MVGCTVNLTGYHIVVSGNHFRFVSFRLHRIGQNLGGAFASQGEHQLAFASFQRAIDLDPRDRFTYFKLGMMYEQLGTCTRRGHVITQSRTRWESGTGVACTPFALFVCMCSRDQTKPNQTNTT